MWSRPRPRLARRSIGTGLRPLLASTLLLGAVGSCELPKPQIPSIGAMPVVPSSIEPAVVGRAAIHSA